ncbi:hypothetical protein SUDANB121_01876 [Nocardiopsis dassonvillei]|uniref:hypothetical protein n=1 Tax=Nocardiopsis dassonvillei TaxID=2014 RepID=UPI003F579518
MTGPARPLLWGLVAPVVAVALAVALMMLPGREETGPVGDRGQTMVESIACAETIVEGEITAVEEMALSLPETADPPDPQAGQEPMVELTIAVREWIKPASGGETTRVTVLDPAYANPGDSLEEGMDVLVTVPRTVGSSAVVRRGADISREREAVMRDLPRAEGVECPEEWGGP